MFVIYNVIEKKKEHLKTEIKNVRHTERQGNLCFDNF